MRNSPSESLTTALAPLPMLSATADHALRATLVLARHRGGRAMRANEIADAVGAPRNYMAKTLNALVKAGLVTSARGPRGGFTLAVAPQSVTLERVIDVFDVRRRHTRCMLGNGTCDPTRPCAAHHRWVALLAARRAPFVTTTLADLIGEHTTPAFTMMNAKSLDHTNTPIDPSLRVNDVLRSHPDAIAIFHGFGIDACCGGPRTLRDAAAHAAIEETRLLEALERFIASEG